MVGKLTSPQSLAIACAASGMIGKETDIFRRAWKYSVLLLLLVIAPIVVHAFVAPGLVPQDISGVNP